MYESNYLFTFIREQQIYTVLCAQLVFSRPQTYFEIVLNLSKIRTCMRVQIRLYLILRGHKDNSFEENDLYA